MDIVWANCDDWLGSGDELRHFGFEFDEQRRIWGEVIRILKRKRQNDTFKIINIINYNKWLIWGHIWVKTGWVGWLVRVVGMNGINESIYYEFDTFTKIRGNFWTCIDILVTIWGTSEWIVVSESELRGVQMKSKQVTMKLWWIRGTQTNCDDFGTSGAVMRRLRGRLGHLCRVGLSRTNTRV